MNLRAIIAIAAIYVVLYGLPEGVTIPDIPLPTPTPQPVGPTVPEPDRDMMETVAEVAEICKQMDAFDRLVWMATWEDTAAIVAGEDEDVSVAFDSVLGLRLFTDSVFEAAWKRLAKASGKYRGLDRAVEQAFADVLGNDVRPWSEEMRDDAVELYEALAWAGARSE